VFHNAKAESIPPPALPHDFAIIWDEDHDERVIQVVEEIHKGGRLASFLFFGERKGTFTALLSDEAKPLQEHLHKWVAAIAAEVQGDAWTTAVGVLGDPQAKPINDDEESVELYLRSLARQWRLGLGRWPVPSATPGPRVIVHSMRVWDNQRGEDVVSPTKRTAENIALLGGQSIPGTAEIVPVSALDDQGRYRPPAQ
jgi:hypothetical protein